MAQEAASVEAALLSIESLGWVGSNALLLSAVLHPEEQDEEMVSYLPTIWEKGKILTLCSPNLKPKG